MMPKINKNWQKVAYFFGKLKNSLIFASSKKQEDKQLPLW
jgi:hypothetical protein